MISRINLADLEHMVDRATIPNYVRTALPDVEWEPPKRNVLPDEVEEARLDEDCSYEELNFDDEV